MKHYRIKYTRLISQWVDWSVESRDRNGFFNWIFFSKLKFVSKQMNRIDFFLSALRMRPNDLFEWLDSKNLIDSIAFVQIFEFRSKSNWTNRTSRKIWLIKKIFFLQISRETKLKRKNLKAIFFTLSLCSMRSRPHTHVPLRRVKLLIFDCFMDAIRKLTSNDRTALMNFFFQTCFLNSLLISIIIIIITISVSEFQK